MADGVIGGLGEREDSEVTQTWLASTPQVSTTAVWVANLFLPPSTKHPPGSLGPHNDTSPPP